jgi:hypothetical protein
VTASVGIEGGLVPVLPNSGELVVPAARGKMLGVALGSAGFVLVGTWMALFAENQAVILVIGALSVAFFGLCGSYAVWRLVRPVPALVITQEGIWDNASAVGVGLIRWDEIAELRECQFRNQVFLGIVPKDLHTVLAKLPAWKRMAIKANGLLGTPSINIPQLALPMKVTVLLREIHLRFGH